MLERSSLSPPKPATSFYCKLLFICTTETPFNFNDQDNNQKDGVSKGSPLGPTFADYYMASTKNTFLSQDRASNPKCYKRYVDDILAEFNKTGHVNWFKTPMKRLSFLNFTHEEFNKNDVHFLDMSFKITDDGSCHTSVYIKPTINGIYSKFNSYTLDSYKEQ